MVCWNCIVNFLPSNDEAILNVDRFQALKHLYVLGLDNLFDFYQCKILNCSNKENWIQAYIIKFISQVHKVKSNFQISVWIYNVT